MATTITTHLWLISCHQRHLIKNVSAIICHHTKLVMPSSPHPSSCQTFKRGSRWEHRNIKSTYLITSPLDHQFHPKNWLYTWTTPLPRLCLRSSFSSCLGCTQKWAQLQALFHACNDASMHGWTQFVWHWNHWNWLHLWELSLTCLNC